jgi:hypothetical protein
MQRPTVLVTNHEILGEGKGVYTGTVDRETLVPHGPNGRMEYNHGNAGGHEEVICYDGAWHLGEWHGYGVLQLKNGDSYVGHLEHDQRHGSGTYLWKDGRGYEGPFVRNQRQGPRGTYTFADGAVYTGEFTQGHRHGQGQYRFLNGNSYSGSWKQGHYDGYGVFTWKDGRVYRGDWRQSKHHGIGVELDEQGSVVHDGMWFDHEPFIRQPQPSQQRRRRRPDAQPYGPAVIIPFYPPKLGTLIRCCVCSVEGSRGKDLQKESI